MMFMMVRVLVVGDYGDDGDGGGDGDGVIMAMTTMMTTMAAMIMPVAITSP